MTEPAGAASFAVADGDVVHVRFSRASDGDFHLEAEPVALRHRRAAFTPGAWTQLDEVHGVEVVMVDEPGAHDGDVGDASVTRCRGAVLAVWVGDCAPVALVSDDGTIGAAHAGWRGALGGVLERTVVAMAPAPGTRVRAVLGPCIHGCCYEFGTDDLATMVDRFGASVAAVTRDGAPSLHMPAVVAAALAPLGVELIDLSDCTRCSGGRWFSHRAGDAGRQVMTVRKMAGR